jgi:FkbM family methyltransferase
VSLLHGIRLSAFAQLPDAWQPVAHFHYMRLRGQLERELPLMCAYLKPGMRAIDAGANDGVYTHAFASTGALVEAFEPQPSCAAVLEGYARRHPGVRVHAVALGSAAGDARLFVPMRGMTPVTGHASLSETTRERVIHDVPVRTLDAYGFDRVGVIKIDVEGHEGDVIRGARQTIAANRPRLLVEIEQRHLTGPIAAVFREVTELGYDGRFVHPELGSQPLSKFDAGVLQRMENADVPGMLYVNNFIFEPRG